MADACDLLPFREVNGRKAGIAFDRRVDFSDFQPVGNRQGPRVHIYTTDHGDIRDRAPQRIAASDGAGVLE